MSDNKRNGASAGKGYYIALILCAAAIGITSYVYYRNAPQAEQPAAQETYVDVPVGTYESQDVPVLATEKPEKTPQAKPTQPAATEGTQPAATAPRKELQTMAPVDGEAIWGYAMEALSYNQTTRDWRVHAGLDLAAEENAPVLASADGKVAAVYEDDALGHVVELSHIDGYSTLYASLSKDVQVQVGDEVKMGQTLGYAADSAITESGLGCHVHFSVTCYGESMDPMEFLSLGQ